jgi:lipoate---protein ligase
MRRWKPRPLVDALVLTAEDLDGARAAIERAAAGIDDLVHPPLSDFSIMRAVRAHL